MHALSLSELCLLDATGDDESHVVGLIRIARDASPDVTIVVLLDRDDQPAGLRYLEAGADGYLLKPFSPHRLAALVRSLSRGRKEAAATLAAPVIDLERLQLVPREQEGYLDGVALGLRRVEFNVLYVLASRPGLPVGRDEIAARALASDCKAGHRSVDVIVARIRRKLAHVPGGAAGVRSVRGEGYALETEGHALETDGGVAFRAPMTEDRDNRAV